MRGLVGNLILVAVVALGDARSLAADAKGSASTKANDWQATVPTFAQKTEQWSELTEKLLKKNMPYGALAAAYRMLMFFNDLPIKEQAYRTIIEIIDRGYAFPTRAYFTTGDIEPKEDYDFANSYYFYKGMAALDKGVRRWADSYLASVDSKNFPKFVFFQALEAYQKKDLARAEPLLLEVLAKKPEARYLSLVKKTARTLARIYFEKQDYGRAYDVYRSFLLKMNPIEPNDWLEAAWSLYYLKRYDEAMGMVFNLESIAGGEMVNLEKYVLRALIYEDVCATEYMENLVTTFEAEFGAAITAIKTGKILSQIPELSRIYVPENQSYYQLTNTLSALEEEQRRIGALPGALRELAEYLYSTEIVVVQKKMPAYVEDAAQRAASQLIGFAEALRFIKFDVAKSRLGPDEAEKPEKKRDETFLIHWVQNGDFWRDERLRYHAVLKNRCVE